MGHSAGGHLALWMVSKHRISRASVLHDNKQSLFSTAISLACVSDLRTGWKQRLGHGIIARLIGGSPDQYLDRYDAGSPIELLPNGARQVLVHGVVDDIVPVSQSEQFVRKAEQLGEKCELVKLEGVGHFELIDPGSAAWPVVVRTVLSTLNENFDQIPPPHFT
jgi:dipeptidyl aminopeptidase/acylaminoacyl peptidase